MLVIAKVSDLNNTMNHSEHKANDEIGAKRGKVNAYEQVTIGFGFTLVHVTKLFVSDRTKAVQLIQNYTLQKYLLLFCGKELNVDIVISTSR